MATIRVDGMSGIKSVVYRVVDESGNVLYESDASPTAEHVAVKVEGDYTVKREYVIAEINSQIAFVVEGEAARRIRWFFSPMREWMRKLAEYSAAKESAN